MDDRDWQDDVETRLAVYGTLAPGEVNHHQLNGLAGRWVPGHVRGTRYERGWGAAADYPAMVLDAQGGEVPVQVFESADLPRHWQRLDEFEGPGYRRVVTHVSTPAGVVRAYLYEAAEEAPLNR